MGDEGDVQADETEDAAASVAKRAGRRGFCLGCVVAGMIGIAVVIVALSLLFSSPEELVAYGQRTLSGPSTVEQAISATEDAQARMLRGLRPDVELRLTDADVNAYIAEHRKELALPRGLRDPRVAFGEGFVVASVRTKMGFVIPVRVRIKLRPEVRDGRLALHPMAGRAGKLPMPATFRKKVARTAGRVIEERLGAAGFDLTGVEVHKGVLIVGGNLRPTAADAEQSPAG